MSTSNKATNFKTQSDIVVQEYPHSEAYNADEVNQCRMAIQSIG